MGRRHAQYDVEKLVKEGRGQGRGADYKPWLAVQSFSSRGYATRVRGWKTRREHHLMSNIERDFFFILDSARGVVDVREQFPLLPVEETMAIAVSAGIRHPVDVRTKRPYVLTTDFLVTVAGQGAEVDQARTIKPAAELRSARTLEKLTIEKEYWATRKIDWAIVTDEGLPKDLIHNLRWLHPFQEISETDGVGKDVLPKVDFLLREFLESGMSLAESGNSCDDRLGLTPGTSLVLARHFIATRRWTVNLQVRIDPARHLRLLRNAHETQNAIVHQHVA
jgi:hypothetical protein